MCSPLRYVYENTQSLLLSYHFHPSNLIYNVVTKIYSDWDKSTYQELQHYYQITHYPYRQTNRHIQIKSGIMAPNRKTTLWVKFMLLYLNKYRCEWIERHQLFYLLRYCRFINYMYKKYTRIRLVTSSKVMFETD